VNGGIGVPQISLCLGWTPSLKKKVVSKNDCRDLNERDESCVMWHKLFSLFGIDVTCMIYFYNHFSVSYGFL
jgi:hypothetical protein